MARPTKLGEAGPRIVLGVRNGISLEGAAAFAGVHPSTLFRWLERGRRGEAKFREFCDDVKKAQATAELRDLQRIRAAAETHWQAAAWFLERRFPERWARVRRTVVRHGGRVEQWR